MNFLDTLDAEIATQERILETHPAYIKLKALRSTRALYVGGPAPVAETKPAQSRGVVRSAPLSGKSLDAVKAVIDYLRLIGSPVRTAELMSILEKDGIQFSGNAPQNILSSLLSRSPDVVSKGGHVGWALTEWDTAGGDKLGGDTPPAVNETQEHGREAGQGGGT